MVNGTCQSNYLIYCLECHWCNIEYIGSPQDRIINIFVGHIFDIKHSSNTTVARHFARHDNVVDLRMTTHILDMYQDTEHLF